MSGRKRLPTKLKIIKGTAEKRRLNENEPNPATCIPTPPTYLDSTALKEWQRITIELDKLGLISEIDRAILSLYCSNYSRLLKYEAIVKIEGEVIETASGVRKINPALQIINICSGQIYKYLSELGMSPASRSKVSGNKEKSVKNEFAEL